MYLPSLVQIQHLAGDYGVEEKKHWRNTLDPKLHNFQGAYHGVPDAYKVDIDHDLELYLRMCPPHQKEYHTYEQYQKRLVGNAVSVPVTLKIRTGWSDDQRNALEVARIAEECGIQALTIHGQFNIFDE